MALLTKQEKERRAEQSVQARTVKSYANKIHSKLPTIRDDLGAVKNFYDINRDVIFDNALNDVANGEIPKEKNGMLYTYRETHNLGGLTTNMARVVAHEYGVYKSIVDIMKTNVSDLSDKLVSAEKQALNHIELVFDKIHPIVMDYYETHGSKIAASHDTKLDLEGLRAQLFIDALQQTEGEKLEEIFTGYNVNGVAYMKQSKSNIIKINILHALTTSKLSTLTIDECFQAILFIDAQTQIDELYRTNTRLGFYRALNSGLNRIEDGTTLVIDLIVVDGDRRILKLDKDKYLDFVSKNDSSILIGYASLPHNVGQTATAEQVLETQVVNQNAHDKLIELQQSKIQNNLETIIRQGLKDTVREFETRCSKTIKERISADLDKSDDLIYLDVLKSVKDLSIADKRDPKKVIEQIYTNYLFKDSGFDSFYKRVIGSGTSDLKVSVSQAFYYVIVSMIFNNM